MDILKAIKDPQFREDVLRGLGETFSRGVAGVAGAPVDIATMAMRPFGYDVPAEQVVGGSEYIGRQMERAGLLSSARNPTAEFLAGMVTPDPMDMAKLGAMAVPVVGKAVQQSSLDDISKKWSEKGVSLDVFESRNRPNQITLSKIEVPKKSREGGIGTDVMKDIVDYANKTGKTIALSPSTDFGATSKNRLVNFYKRFGFVENKGKNRDFEISESMYRSPQIQQPPMGME